MISSRVMTRHATPPMRIAQTGGRRQEAEGRRQKAGGRRQEAEVRRQEAAESWKLKLQRSTQAAPRLAPTLPIYSGGCAFELRFPWSCCVFPWLRRRTARSRDDRTIAAPMRPSIRETTRICAGETSGRRVADA